MYEEEAKTAWNGGSLGKHKPDAIDYVREEEKNQRILNNISKYNKLDTSQYGKQDFKGE